MKRSQGTFKRLVILLALGSVPVVGAVGCGRNVAAAGPPIVAVPAPVVQIAKPERRTVERTVDAPGDVQAYQQAMLYAKVSGYLRSVLVDKGDRVRAGQLLATIEAPEMQQEAAQAQETAQSANALVAGNPAARAHAVSDYRQAEATVARAQADLAAVRAGLPKAVAERDAAAAEVQKSLEQEHQAETAVTQAQAGLAQTKTESDLDRQTYDRLKRIYDRDAGLLARQDLDAAESKMKVSESRVVAAEEAIEVARQGVAAVKQAVAAARSKQAAAETGIDVAKAQIHAGEKQVTTVRAQAGAARSQIGVIEAQGRSVVYQSQASRRAAQRAADLLAYTQIRAPFAGTITQRLLDPGALVQSAANSAQGSTKSVLALANSEVVRITAQVSEPDAPYVRPGTRATVRADALSGTRLAGRVTRTSGVLDTSTRTMLVEIDLPNRSHVLNPGMLVKVTLDLQSHANALTVPTSAVVFEKDKRSVFVVDGGKAKKVSVKTGFEGAQWVEIASGLTGNEEIIVVGKENVSAGAAVEVKQTP